MAAPPRFVRRVFLAPLVWVICVVVLTSTPVVIFLAALVSPILPGARWRVLRVTWFVLLYLALELVALTALFLLWVATGFGAAASAPWSQRVHYRAVGLFLAVLQAEAERVLGARIVSEGWTRDEHLGSPLIVIARHAGFGDSFLLVAQLINALDREPRIVMKEALQWEPALGCALNRLPTRFIDAKHGGEQAIASISALADRLDGNDALLIFPEGGNVTPAGRARAIARLRDAGLDAEAEQAKRLRWMMAPRPGGALAAVQRATDADVVLVAHAGLDHLTSVQDVYRSLPLDGDIRMRYWHVPAHEVPRDEEAFTAWLMQWWATMDAWLEQVQDPRVRAWWAAKQAAYTTAQGEPSR